MKKNEKPKKNTFKKLKNVLRVWFFICIAIIIFGIVFGPNKNDGKHYVNFAVIFIGMAMLTVGCLIIAIAMLVELIKDAKAYNKYLEENNIDEREEEEAFKTYINNTNHNQEATAFRALSMWLRVNKYAPKEKGVRSYVNLVLLILFACCSLTFVPLLCAGQIVAGLSILGSAFTLLFALLIINWVHKKISTNSKNIDHNVPSKLATVISCTLCDEGMYSSGQIYSARTNRILFTTYLIALDVDGELKKAYSKTYYNKGEKVNVYQNKKLKDIVIIGEEK